MGSIYAARSPATAGLGQVPLASMSRLASSRAATSPSMDFCTAGCKAAFHTGNPFITGPSTPMTEILKRSPVNILCTDIERLLPFEFVYGGFLDKIPMGSAINRGLTFRMAQTPVQHYLPKLLERIEKGEIDPSFVITHRASLEDGPELYKTFRAKKDGCIKVVMKPH